MKTTTTADDDDDKYSCGAITFASNRLTIFLRTQHFDKNNNNKRHKRYEVFVSNVLNVLNVRMLANNI